MNSVVWHNWAMARKVKADIFTVASYCLISLLAETCDICVDFGDVLKVLRLCVFAMSWLRQLVVALLVQRVNFNPRTLYVEFVVNRVTRTGFSMPLSFYQCSILIFSHLAPTFYNIRGLQNHKI
jgi:hypothetical protein